MKGDLKERLKTYFDNVYANKLALQSLQYPILKILSDNFGKIDREGLVMKLKETYGLDVGKSQLRLDHQWSQRFAKGEEKDFLNELVKHDGKDAGDPKLKYELRKSSVESVREYLKENPKSLEEIKELMISYISSKTANDSFDDDISITVAKEIVGFYLAKFGDNVLTLRFLNKTWKQIYESFFTILGEGSNLESFRNGLKNKRDFFDSHFKNSREGWKEPDGTPSILVGDKIKVFQKYNTYEEDELWEIVSRYCKISNKNVEENFVKKINHSKNTILFGPPGTGKTYNSINKAIAIANPEFNLNQDRDSIKSEYDRLVDLGQIVFTTFHQSMSYEDFIEGIKPKMDGKSIIYRIEPGIFKRICEEASFSSSKVEEVDLTKEEIDFSNRYDSYVEYLRNILLSGKFPELESRSGGSVLVEKISDQDNIVIKHHDGKVSYPISKFRLTKLDTAFPDLSKVENIDRQFREVIGGSNSSGNWSVLNAIRNFKPDHKIISNEAKKIKNDLNFVLIIDEINRGNVSQIFGEIITLIEDNKRLGSSEALKILLPYSKMPFGVPSNVHIIGTMNTADRSVESLDTALRRRFSFEEMAPQVELIKSKIINNINLSEVLETINLRIEKLLNKDHLIGHSFFLKVNDLDGLRNSFANEIIPLLQEYFYGDFGKIGLVLGSSFVEDDSKVKKDIFAKFASYEVDDLNSRVIYNIKDIKVLRNEEFIKAVLSIIGK